MADESTPISVGRHILESSVTIGRGGLKIDFGEEGLNHVSAEVNIEVSGAESDRPHTYELLEALEDAVEDTVEELDGGDE